MRKRDKAFLRNVEITTQAPEIGGEEVGLFVFRRRGDGADLGLLALVGNSIDDRLKRRGDLGTRQGGLQARLPGSGAFAVLAGVLLPPAFLAPLQLLTRNRRVDRVFLTLLIPGGFPIGALAEPGFAVAQRRDEWDGVLGHQLGDQRIKVERRTTRIEGGDGRKIWILAGRVSQGAGRDQPRFCCGPKTQVLQPVEQPVSQRLAFLSLPRSG
jgi:hypothetical protein